MAEEMPQRGRLNSVTSTSSYSFTEAGGRARVPPADQWAFKDPLREKINAKLRDLNQRITVLHSAEIMRYHARRPTLTAPSRRQQQQLGQDLSTSQSRIRSAGPSQYDWPQSPGGQLSGMDAFPPIGLERKNYLNVPKVEARRHVIREVDKKAQRVVHEVTREFFDALRAQALSEYERAVKQRRGLPGSQKIIAKTERTIENQILRAVDIEMDRLRSKLPADFQMRQTIMTNAKDRIRALMIDYEKRFEEELRDARSPLKSPSGNVVYHGHGDQYDEEEEYEEAWSEDEHVGTTLTPGRRGSLIRNLGRPSSVKFNQLAEAQAGEDFDGSPSHPGSALSPEQRLQAALSDGSPLTARRNSVKIGAVSRRSITGDGPEDDSHPSSMALSRSSMRRLSGVGLALESLGGLQGFKSPCSFYFYQPDELAESSNRRAAVALARRKSLTGPKLLDNQPSSASLGVLSSASSSRALRVRRASTLGAADRQSKVGALSEADKDLQEYVKGTIKELQLPMLVQFASAIKLCSIDLDMILTKDKGALSRLEEVVEIAVLAESVDFSHNNLGNHWLHAVLDTIETIRHRVRRIDLSGNMLNEIEPEEENPEDVLPPEEIMVPRVPRDLIHRKADNNRGYSLGDFYYLVDLETQRRQTLQYYLPDHYRPPAPAPAPRKLGPLEQMMARTSGTSVGVRTSGSAALGLEHHGHPAGAKVSFNIRMLRDFLKRISGAGMSVAAMSQMLRNRPSAMGHGHREERTPWEVEFTPVLETLLLRYNKMDARCLRALLPGLAAVTTLNELDLSQNPLGPHAGEAIGHLIRTCPSLKALALSWCELTADAVFHIATAITEEREKGAQHPLQALDLSHNSIGADVTPALHHIASESQHLIELHLSSCDLNNDVALGLASGLMNRPDHATAGLRLLNLNSNSIDMEAINALKMVIRHRFQNDRPRMMLFAEGYDDGVFVDALARLQKATSMNLGLSLEGAGNADSQSARSNRMQRRLSSAINADNEAIANNLMAASATATNSGNLRTLLGGRRVSFTPADALL